MTCGRCHRRIKGAHSWLMGYPLGPVCAKKMGLQSEREGRAKAVVRDTKTMDLFEGLDHA
jgi:hypothetical protein